MARPLAAKLNLPMLTARPAFLGFVFAEADRWRPLGSVYTMAGTKSQFTWPCLAGDPLGDGDAVFLGFVREHRAGDDVTDGPDVGRGGLEVGIDLDALLVVELHAG